MKMRPLTAILGIAAFAALIWGLVALANNHQPTDRNVPGATTGAGKKTLME